MKTIKPRLSDGAVYALPSEASFVAFFRRPQGLLEDQLANLHPRPKTDRQMAVVDDLKPDAPVETGMDRRGRHVDSQSEAPE